jgi:hypothetical protein
MALYSTFIHILMITWTWLQTRCHLLVHECLLHGFTQSWMENIQKKVHVSTENV